MEEQTPINAEEFYNSKPRSFRLQPRMDMEMISLDSAFLFAEAFAKDKVEKAIQQEREKWKEILKEEIIELFVEANTSCDCDECKIIKEKDRILANDYYETQVKPRIDK